MASRLVPGRTLGEGRYAVERALEPGRYLVRSRDGEERALLRDLGPVPDAPERVERLERAVQEMKGWSHPRLARLLEGFSQEGRYYLALERRAGVALETMLGWRSEPVEDRLILRWAAQLAEAAAFLEARQWPFLDSCLKTSSLAVSSSEDLWIEGFGFARFLTAGAPEKAPQDTAQKQFAELLGELSGGEGLDRLPLELAYLGARARDGSFPSFQALQRHLHDPGEAVTLVAPPQDQAAPPRPGSFLERALRRSPWRLALELFGLLALVLGLWWATRGRPREPYPGVLVYVACEDALRVVEAESGEELDVLRGVGIPQALAADGEHLFVSARNQRTIQILEARTGRRTGAIPVEQPATRLAITAGGTRLLAASPSARLLTVLEIAAGGLHLEPTAFLAATSEDFRFALLPRPALPVELVLADAGRLTRYTLEPAARLTERELAAAGPLAVSPDASRIAVQQGAGVLMLEPEQLREVGRLSLPQAEELSSLFFSLDGSILWAAGATGSLTGFSLERQERLHRIWLPGAAGTPAQVGGRLWIPVASRNSVLLFEPSTGRIRSELPLGAGPHAVQSVP